MADCSDTFKKFDKEITLRATEKKYLRRARKSIVENLKNKLSDKSHVPSFRFKVQGSFSMGTIIRPLRGEFDIDVGVYFDFGSNDRNEWTTPTTVSGWLKEALSNHTSTFPENKKTCVRVTYKPLNNQNEYGYHVDLPIYAEYEGFWGDRYTVIGMNDERKWSEKSNPLAFTRWFNEKCLKNKKDRKQLIRIVKYLKAWKDFKTSNIKMPSGMILTILAAKNYEPDDRDDIVLLKILKDVYFLLWWDFSITKPVAPNNNLVSSYTSEQKEFFMANLREFRDDADKAIGAHEKGKSIQLWKKHLGDRFS